MYFYCFLSFRLVDWSELTILGFSIFRLEKSKNTQAVFQKGF